MDSSQKEKLQKFLQIICKGNVSIKLQRSVYELYFMNLWLLDMQIQQQLFSYLHREKCPKV